MSLVAAGCQPYTPHTHMADLLFHLHVHSLTSSNSGCVIRLCLHAYVCALPHVSRPHAAPGLPNVRAPVYCPRPEPAQKPFLFDAAALDGDSACDVGDDTNTGAPLLPSEDQEDDWLVDEPTFYDTAPAPAVVTGTLKTTTLATTTTATGTGTGTGTDNDGSEEDEDEEDDWLEDEPTFFDPLEQNQSGPAAAKVRRSMRRGTATKNTKPNGSRKASLAAGNGTASPDAPPRTIPTRTTSDENSQQSAAFGLLRGADGGLPRRHTDGTDTMTAAPTRHRKPDRPPPGRMSMFNVVVRENSLYDTGTLPAFNETDERKDSNKQNRIPPNLHDAGQYPPTHTLPPLPPVLIPQSPYDAGGLPHATPVIHCGNDTYDTATLPAYKGDPGVAPPPPARPSRSPVPVSVSSTSQYEEPAQVQ